ncbi:MAG: alcohol dehydrogenase [Candidatus Electrothrix sp. MAN1_4]|nr:alcohol dehydrogenase [Candidatus Electrothrix sp. MAN1_4]
MKAFVVNAEWCPQADYVISKTEAELRRANIGSSVWKNPVFEMLDLPVPIIDDDELLIRVKRCGVCGSDTHVYETAPDGHIIFSGPVKMPCVLGHEYAGVVEQVGSKVKNFKVGDYVAAESVVWCGKCQPCRSGAFNQCDNVELTGITVDGALAEFIGVNERQCWKINDLVQRYNEDELFDIGALIEPLGCAYNGLFISASGFKPGGVVVVYGAGPIGLGAVVLAKTAGAAQVIAFDPIAERLAIAKSMGADYTYNINTLSDSDLRPHKIVLEKTGGKGAEIQVEAAGAAQATIPEMEKSLAVNGKIVYLGRAATSTPLMLDVLVSGANAVIGARGHCGYGIYPNIIKLLTSGRIQVSDMITSTYPFTEVFEALKKSVDRKDGKIIIQIS